MKPDEQLTAWVEAKHKGQIKKYTGKPYINHLLTVAEMAKPVTMLGYEIGLCHDLLEDTDTSENELFETLLGFGYDDMEANYITVRVVELTDVFTADAYPGLTRDERKEREAARTFTISPGAQTVKYCDLIDNMQTVIKYDQKNAQQYLHKKALLLNSLVAGDRATRQKALDVISQGLQSLEG